MKRPRPHIPLSVRIAVAERQLTLLAGGPEAFAREFGQTFTTKKDRLTYLLEWMASWLDTPALHLDHNPALRLRPYNPRIKNVTARYTPNANDPTALIYRTAHDHHIKTNVRGDGAQRPDTSAIKRERRREKPRRRRKRAWPSRPFPKGRKLMSRSSFRRTP